MPIHSESSHRRCNRIYVSMPADVFVDDEGRRISHAAATVDFSMFGARIRGSATLSPGQLVRLLLPGVSKTCLGRVIWTAAVPSSQLREIGLEFLKPFEVPVQTLPAKGETTGAAE